MSTTATARGSTYRQYSRSSSSSSSENLPPRTLARVAREVRDLHKNPPEGIKLTVDGDGAGSLSELLVSCLPSWRVRCRSILFHVYRSFNSVGRFKLRSPFLCSSSCPNHIFINQDILSLFCHDPLFHYELGWDWRSHWHSLRRQVLSTQVGYHCRVPSHPSKRPLLDEDLSPKCGYIKWIHLCQHAEERLDFRHYI